MDKFIVRLSIVSLNLYMIIATIFAFYGESIWQFDYLFTNSFVGGLVLTTLCHSQGKYHCVWMRALCYNLIFVPLLNFFDSLFPLFTSVNAYFILFYSVFGITWGTTLYLAIRHFRKVKHLNKKRDEQRKTNR